MEARNDDQTRSSQSKVGARALDTLSPSALTAPPRPGNQTRQPARSRQTTRATNPWARGLGWFSIGLGTAELLAPSQLAQLIGVRDSSRSRSILRALGAREVAAGVGLLLPKRPGRYLWSRVAGDVVDLALLGGAMAFDRRTDSQRAGLALAAVAGVTALDTWASLRRQDEPDDDSAALARATGPRRSKAQDPSVPVRAVITIHRPATEIYAFWRDFTNLARFMTHVRSVEVKDRLRSRWHASITGREELEWDAVITDDRPDHLIAWRSVADATFDHVGEVRFLPAPGGRGTEVHLKMNVLPPAGKLGKAVGKLIHRLPEQVITSDLGRLKQLLETGQVMKSDASIHKGPHPARPAADDEHPTD
jgi:uncharacterized membrane protein